MRVTAPSVGPRSVIIGDKAPPEARRWSLCAGCVTLRCAGLVCVWRLSAGHWQAGLQPATPTSAHNSHYGLGSADHRDICERWQVISMLMLLLQVQPSFGGKITSTGFVTMHVFNLNRDYHITISHSNSMLVLKKDCASSSSLFNLATDSKV